MEPEAAYLVRVDGVGRGTARASYNDYGSVGAYTLAVTGCDLSPVPPEPEPPAALADRPTIRKVRPGARGGARTATIVWAPPGNAGPAGVDGYQVRAFRLRGRRVVRRLDSPWRDADDRRFKFDARLAQRYQFAVRARGEAGVGPWSRRSRAVRLR